MVCNEFHQAYFSTQPPEELPYSPNPQYPLVACTIQGSIFMHNHFLGAMIQSCPCVNPKEDPRLLYSHQQYEILMGHDPNAEVYTVNSP